MGIIGNGWERVSRRAQAEGKKAVQEHLMDRLTGIGAKDVHISVGSHPFRGNTRIHKTSHHGGMTN